MLPQGFTPWRDVFACLRDLRVWGPADRVQPLDVDVLVEEIEGRADDELVPLEIELVFRASAEAGAISEATVTAAIRQSGGRVLSRSRLDDISYHAILAELPVAAVRIVVERGPGGLAGVDPIMHIRPQSVVTEIDANDLLPAAPAPAPGPVTADPILALLDGVPVAGHPLLQSHLSVEDPYELVSVAGGWQHRTRPRFAETIRASTAPTQSLAASLSETEAMVVTAIGYFQPITRAELSKIFGREISRDTIAGLRDAGFIVSGPRSPTPGAPYTYVTTKLFLSVFGFETLRDLPNIEALEDAGLLSRRTAEQAGNDAKADIGYGDDDD